MTICFSFPAIPLRPVLFREETFQLALWLEAAVDVSDEEIDTGLLVAVRTLSRLNA